MNPIPITFCLMTTTKGHFGVKDRFEQTLRSFDAALPLAEYAARIAHIKVSPDEDVRMESMTTEIKLHGFDVWRTRGTWSHGQDSHQLEYLKDTLKMVNEVKTPYVLMVEDDWQVKTYQGNFIDYLKRGVEYLEQDPGLVQVRIPRWSNELDRINGLMTKHNLPRFARRADEYHFRNDDFSMHPSLYRTRDLRAALHFVAKTNMPKHIEHGLGEALKIVSGYPAGHFACFNPDKIRIGHLGTLPGEEDPLDKPLFSS